MLAYICMHVLANEGSFWKCVCVVLLVCFATSSILLNQEACRPVVQHDASYEMFLDRVPKEDASCLNAFSSAELRHARELRGNWTTNLPFEMEKMLNQNAASNSIEREYPLGHARFDMLGPVAPVCRDLESFGHGDGEKRACGLSNQIQASKEECTIVSIGSNNEWDFEIAIFNKYPSCRIETFDCTMPAHIKPPPSISSRTRLHRVCIGPDDTSEGYKSWTSILALANINTAPLFLKMDIEGHEYQVLHNIIRNNVLLPLQIAFELHYQTITPGVPWAAGGQRKGSGEIATFMEYLHYQGGYFLVDIRHNSECPHCSELLITRLHGCMH